jgi:hypothetical protein
MFLFDGFQHWARPALRELVLRFRARQQYPAVLAIQNLVSRGIHNEAAHVGGDRYARNGFCQLGIRG